eukprot:TRINITY_DN3586_c0_g1_i1.p1 TRINITY_DN3586_c0_g1~~TRINITY_DN3586_c0_g1_i1.p1  ORF type:complete len:273 (-),score=43.78 TRINITY_DN3586_c0_g1_i1:168-986(-)
MGILNAESIPNTVQDEEAMHQSRASHPPPQDATNVAVPAPAPTLRNNQAIEVISTQEDSVDARYKLKRSTKVVAIVGLVTSLVGLIVGYSGLGVGMPTAIFFLGIFTILYLVSWGLLVGSLCKRIANRGTTRASMVLGILSFIGHVGDLIWSAAYIGSYCNATCVADTHSYSSDCSFYPQYCRGGIVGVIGMSIHLFGMIFLLTAVGKEQKRCPVITEVKRTVIIQQPAVQYVQTQPIVYTTNGATIVTTVPPQYGVQPSIIYVQTPHSSMR